MSACYCDGEAPSFYREEMRKARKEHRCSECGSIIANYEKYMLCAGSWDGEFHTFKTCSRCLALSDYIKSNIPCFCWTLMDLREQALEVAREYAHELPGLLFGAYRLEVKIRRNKKQCRGL